MSASPAPSAAATTGYAVLYVDDEEQALKYFRKGFDKEFRVLTANCVPAALEVLAKEGASVGVVLTDQRMPGQLGVELLKQVKQKWPDVLRILITAYSDIDSAIEAVNTGSVYKYITKPADLPALKQTLKEALAQFTATRERETILREKMSVLQRTIVADRVRSLAAMASGITHHLRNSITAMSCYLEEVTAAEPGKAPAAAAGGSDAYLGELLALAQQEREKLVQMVQAVGQHVTEPQFKTAQEAEVEALVKAGVESSGAGARAEAVVEPGLPRLTLDAAAVSRAIGLLIAQVARSSKNGGKVKVCASPAGAGVRVRVVGEGVEWTEADVASFFTPFSFHEKDPSNLGLGLLDAFFTAYGHGGDVVVNQFAPEGPGFDLILPTHPADAARPQLGSDLLPRLLTEGQGLPVKRSA